MNPPRPHAAYKLLTVLLLAEISTLHALVIDRISLLNLYPGVDNGNQMDVLGLHLLHKPGEIGELALVHRKILKPLHVVNIHVHTVKRHPGVPVFLHHLADIFFVFIAPPALAISKSPLGRDIASADNLSELPYHLPQVVPLQDIQVKSSLVHGDSDPVSVRVT